MAQHRAEPHHHVAGNDRHEGQAGQPAGALAELGEDRGVEVGFLRLVAADTGDLLDILGALFLKDLHRVVVGDDAEQVLEFIDHRQRDEVVFQQHVRRFLLVGGGQHALRADLTHDVAHRRVPGVEGEIAEPQLADQPALHVDHEDPAQGLGRLLAFPQHLDRLLDRLVRENAAGPGGHAAARGVVIVFQQRTGQLLVFRAEQAEEAQPRLVAHVLQDVHPVIVGELAEQDLQLGGREGIESLLDHRVRQVDDHVRRLGRADGLQEILALVLVDLLIGVGEVGVVDFLGQGADGTAILRLDRAQQFVDREGGVVIRHGGIVGSHHGSPRAEA